jgi:glycosyltransferase involved in cell wall biosynthesis
LAKIVFIASRFPYPLNKGDKLRVFFQLKYLAADHDVHLIALEESDVPKGDLAAVSAFCASVRVFVLPRYRRIGQLLLSPFKRLPLQVAYFYHPGIARKIERLIADIAPDTVHCHLIRTTEYVRSVGKVHKSLDFMDAFGKGMERRQLAERSFLKRLLYRYEKNLLYAYESRVLDFTDVRFIISDQDRQAIRNPKERAIAVIPNGVDFQSFYPRTEKKIYDLLFMGNLAYPPNIDAVRFLSEEVLPLVKAQLPGVRLLIAGIDPPGEIRKLKSENIDVIEHFNHISDSIALSKIMLAPMRLSIGLQNKILQAMAMQTPCIVSTLSNNAIQAPNNRAIVEANTPGEIAGAILELLADEANAMRIAGEGYAFVREHYSWKVQNELFTNLISQQQ